MGKLKDLVTEQVPLQERVKTSARRVRLAGIGLVFKVDAERSKLFRQIVALGESYGDQDSVVGRISLISTGTLNLVIEESQKLFDELVVTGEQALAGTGSRPQPKVNKITTQRPVAKAPAPHLVKASPKPVTRLAAASPKPQLKPVATIPESKSVPESLLQNFQAAKAQLNTLASPPDQMTMLTLYALYKQATESDVSGKRPAMTKMVERAKYDSRDKIRGMSIIEAMERYISTVAKLFPVPA